MAAARRREKHLERERDELQRALRQSQLETHAMQQTFLRKAARRRSSAAGNGRATIKAAAAAVAAAVAVAAAAFTRHRLKPFTSPPMFFDCKHRYGHKPQFSE